jgi:predicted RNA-binding Zn-ribbon protein involved in translation (DUF1610 family)
MIKITCTSCQKPLSLDETKLPMKEVSFPCPVCKTKVTVDRRNLGAATKSADVVASPPPETENEDEFGSKAFIVGADNPTIREAAKQIGFLPVHYASAEQARDRILQDTPQVIMINPPQMSPPPLEAMQPIISLMPAERRKSFFILFSENLRTLDGNAAFLYGVNLVVANKDLPNFPQIYKDAYTFHERLYSKMNSVLRAMEGV